MGTGATGFASTRRRVAANISTRVPIVARTPRRVCRWDNDWTIETAMTHKDQWLYAIDFSGD